MGAMVDYPSMDQQTPLHLAAKQLVPHNKKINISSP